ncbi:hypothetical protein CHS0354_013529 [Potamilus streckersoni]|uniref:Uncharacterized protein n=1 Tax=Potamilus streckersoni TaxID=2493646 RepID=A0AAE0W9Z8_9BIVA|nr:hypothetical protein CHS0354_013529 [Potamilus streckersoni]
MKLRMMNFPLLISLLLLVLLIFPLKSEFLDDHNLRDIEEESSDYDDKDSHEDDSHEDNEDAPEKEYATTKSNATNGIDGTQAMTTVQAKPGTKMAQSGQDGQQETDGNVAVKIGVPVALFVMLILFEIIRIVYSGQLKDRVLEQGKVLARISDDSTPIYIANGLSSGKTTSETFDNRTYASQGEQQFGNYLKAGNVYNNTDQGIYLCDDAPQTGLHDYEEIDLKFPSNNRNTTCQTIDEGRASTF